MTALGLIALPAMLPAQPGVSTRDRKVLLNIDSSLAPLFGIPLKDSSTKMSRRVQLDHADLRASYAGGIYVDTFENVKKMLDTADDASITNEITNVGTVAYLLSQASAVKLGLIKSGGDVDYRNVFIACQGASTDAVIGIFETEKLHALRTSDVAAFFASDIFDRPLTIEGSIIPQQASRGDEVGI